MKKEVETFKIEPGAKVDLNTYPTVVGSRLTKMDGHKLLKNNIAAIAQLQEQLFAEQKQSLLIIIQAMDAGGKDSAIEHVFSGINPQGCRVINFKAPKEADYKNNFLVRHKQALPDTGMIYVHNRSHYEYTLIARVHPEKVLLERDLKLKDPDQVNDQFWDKRFQQIRAFERSVERSGTKVIKFFLHISKDEQKERFLKRLNNPDKHWKFAPEDLEERKLWEQYMMAYQLAIAQTTTAKAPWYIIPADKKWYARATISQVILNALEAMDPTYPEPDRNTRKLIKEYIKRLEG